METIGAILGVICFGYVLGEVLNNYTPLQGVPKVKGQSTTKPLESKDRPLNMEQLGLHLHRVQTPSKEKMGELIRLRFKLAQTQNEKQLLQRLCKETTGHKDDGGMFFSTCEYCKYSDGL